MSAASFRRRLMIFALLSLLCLALLLSSLYGLRPSPGQVGDAEAAAQEPTVLRRRTIPAPRGEIFDRNGVPLVANRPVYALCFDYFGWEPASACTVIRDTLALLDENGISYEDAMPLGAYPPYRFTCAPDSAAARRMARFLRAYGIDPDLGAEDSVAALRRVLRMPEEFTLRERRRVLGMLYDMFAADFTYDHPFTVARDVPEEVVSVVSEQRARFPGAVIETQYVRELRTPYAAHVLGRTGLILAEDYEDFAALGYPMDAIVGRDGAERAFESYLRGVDGLRFIETGLSGGTKRVIGETHARAGGDVVLTLDITLQQAAEESLARRVRELRGAGVEAGGAAAVVLRTDSAEILALASYPTFDLASFSSDYPALAADPMKPMFNRAISGTYAPGSTFKMVTAAAALSAGAITPETRIDCEGVYSYYAPDWLYRCWIWRDYGRTHGPLTAAEALMVSCNCFFYEAGRLTGIETIDSFAARFGLGEYTGIELSGEARGTVAGPGSRDGGWYAGDTLQAAIGQSDHLFTPLQLANYTAVLANGGTRYAAHLLRRVEYPGGSVFDPAPEVLSALPFDDAIRDVVTQGMRAVTEDGTASTVFADFPVSVLGKSGSAQVGTGQANGIFLLAAPAEAPEIAVCVVIEHGASGNNAALVARDILAAYFGV